jgi:hypothetical protein
MCRRHRNAKISRRTHKAQTQSRDFYYCAPRMQNEALMVTDFSMQNVYKTMAVCVHRLSLFACGFAARLFASLAPRARAFDHKFINEKPCGGGRGICITFAPHTLGE